MMSRRAVVVLLSGTIFFIPAFLFGLDRAYLFRTSNDHYIEPAGNESYINWSAGYIYARSTVKLPRIIFDRHDPDFGGEDTERSISDARSRAREEAKERASLSLMKSIGSLRLDGNHTFYEKLKRDMNMQDKQALLSSKFIIKSDRIGDGTVTMEIALPFTSEDGLIPLVLDGSSGKEEIPEPDSIGKGDRISGIIIDVSLVPNYHPLLLPRIYTDQGRMIFGPELATQKCMMRRGPVAYHTNADRARSDARAGIYPYYIYATGSRGKNNGDIYIDTEDAVRITGSKEGRAALKTCSIVILLP